MSKQTLKIIAITLVSVGAVAAVAGFLYYRSFWNTPQYSLALLVDAAKRDDKPEIDKLVNIDTVVDDFVPQITNKAVEMYGRGLPPTIIGKVAKLAAPLFPALKQRARAELPRVIRDRTARFGNVPFFAMVLGAEKYLDITVTGDTALVKSKLPEHTLEMTMRRIDGRWQIAGVKDEKLATDIARAVGQQIITIAIGGLNKESADTLGVGNLADLLRQAEELVR